MHRVTGGEDRSDGLAPVIPLFADATHDDADRDEPDRDDGRIIERGRADRGGAEKLLRSKLRARSLSIAEAEAILRQREVDDDTVAAILGDFGRLGYLDDRALADQLVRAGRRKAQGRSAITASIVARRIHRSIAEAALDAVPDDDSDRALAFARDRARTLARYDDATALRRLAAQLSRRGFAGPVALTAARMALAEHSSR